MSNIRELPEETHVVLPAGPRDALRPLQWKVGDRIVDTYDVLELFEGGAMGTVYRVHHRGWRIDLAVKTPRREMLIGPRAVDAFVREAQIWIDLGLHPNVAACFYVRTLAAVPCVFAEFVAGGSLHDWIAGKRLYQGGRAAALRRILDVAVQFAWGLGFAHEMGVVHRDVKPGNVLLGIDGTAKISDFGLANADTRGRMSPAYCSPEQSAGRPLGRGTDIWSWALSVVEMFVGECTWVSGLAAPDVLVGAENGPVRDDLPRMPAALASVLRSCFAEDPDARPATIDEVATVVAQIYSRECQAAYPRRRPEPSKLLADSLNNRGVSLLDLGDAKGAIEALRAALKADPAHVAANVNLAQVLWDHWDLVSVPFDTGDLEHQPNELDIGRHFDAAIERGDGTARPWVARAAFRLRLGDAIGALDDADAALRVDPQEETASLLKGTALLELGRSKKALAWLEHLRARGSDDVHLLREIARARYAEGAEPGAVAALLRQVCTATPDDVHAWADLGSILTMANDRAGAQEAFDRALTLRGDCPYALLRAADHAEWTGREPEARQLLRRALDACPGLLLPAATATGLVSELPSPQLHEGKGAAWPRLDGPCANDDAWLLAPASLSFEIIGRHDKGVMALAVTPDGLLAVTSDLNSVSLWDLDARRERQRIPSSATFATFVGKRLLLGGTTVVLLDENGAGTVLRHADRQTSEERQLIGAVAAFGDGRRAATCRWADTHIEIWNLEQRRVERTIKKGIRDGLGFDGAFAIAVTPDGESVYTGGHDCRLRLFNIATGEEISNFRMPEPVTTIAISPFGTYVLTGNKDRGIRVQTDPGAPERTLTGHAGIVTDVAFFPDGRRALSVSADGELRLWDLARGRVLYVSKGPSEGWAGARLCKAGRLIVAVGRDGSVQLGSAEWQEEHALPLRPAPAPPMLVRPASAEEAASTEIQVQRAIEEADAATAEPTVALRHLRTALAVPGHARDDAVLTRIATLGSRLPRMRVRDSWRRAEMRPGFGVFCVTFSPDARFAAVGLAQGRAQVFEVPSGAPRKSSPGHSGCGWGVVMVDGDTYFHLSEPWIHQASISRSGVIDWKVRNSTLASINLTSLVATSDGRRIFAGGSDDRGALLFAVRGDPDCKLDGSRLHPAALSAMAISPGGDRLVSASLDGSVSLWDVSGDEPRLLRKLQVKSPIRSLVFLPDRCTMLAGDQDGVLSRWDLTTMTPIASLGTLSAPVRSLAPSTDGRFAALAAGKEVVLVDLESGHRAALGAHSDVALSVAFSPDDRFVLSGGDQRACLWEIDWLYAGESGETAATVDRNPREDRSRGAPAPNTSGAQLSVQPARLGQAREAREVKINFKSKRTKRKIGVNLLGVVVLLGGLVVAMNVLALRGIASIAAFFFLLGLSWTLFLLSSICPACNRRRVPLGSSRCPRCGTTFG